MTPRRAMTRLGGLVVVTAALLTFVVVQGYSPFLGLDLQGGVSVVLEAQAPDPSASLDRIVDALTTESDALGLGTVTVARDGDRVVVTPGGEVGADQLDAAVDIAAGIAEGLGVGEVDVRRDGERLVVTVDAGVPDSSLDQAIEIIRNRIDALGVAEPEITRQGKNIVVQIPGVDDPDAALELVGQTAKLRFRPVLNFLPPEGEELPPPETIPAGDPTATDPTATDPTATDPTATDPTATDPTATTPGSGDPATIDPTASASTTASSTPADSVVSSAPSSGDEEGAGVTAGGEAALGPLPAQAPGDSTVPSSVPTDSAPTDSAPTDSVPTDSVPTDSVPTDSVPTDSVPTDSVPTDSVPLDLGDLTNPPTTPDEEDLPEAIVVLEGREEGIRYQLGPSLLTGSALSGATAQVNPQGQWEVVVTFKGGENGIDAFNAAAGLCFNRSPECPTGQLAIVLDHEVVSAPAINAPTFDGSAVISGGDPPFTEDQARDLALVLRYGALPVELEAQNTVRVSATLGSEALDAALVSGAVAFVLVALYMMFQYRLLGLLAVIKLGIEGALLWSVVSWLSETQGLALTLAGITGIIVSIGISVDSNIVYYEHLKEDVLSGRTLRATVDRSFASAFSTIVKADVASLIGAFLLWWLTVGPVRGFAFYLGLSTLLDLLASYFYMHPVVLLTVNRFGRRPRLLGMPVPPGDEGAASVVRSAGRGEGPVDLDKVEA